MVIFSHGLIFLNQNLMSNNKNINKQSLMTKSNNKPSKSYQRYNATRAESENPKPKQNCTLSSTVRKLFENIEHYLNNSNRNKSEI